MIRSYCDLCRKEVGGLQPLDYRYQTSIIGEVCKECMDRCGKKLQECRDAHDLLVITEMREWVKQTGIQEFGHEDKPI